MRKATKKPLRAAALMIVLAAAGLVWTHSLRSRGASPEMEALVAAANALPHRPIVARVSADLAYRPAAATRGASEVERSSKWRLSESAAAIDARAQREGTTSSLHELGIAHLLVGSPRRSAATLEEALLAETRERDLIDAIHASGNAALLNDLAAAQNELARVSANEDPHVAIEAAQRAWTLNRTPVTAWNRALAVERIHVRELARAAWRDYLAIDAHSEWTAEARVRASRVSADSLFAEWTAAKPALLPLARDRDKNQIAQIARRFAQYARVYVEDEVLPKWGEAYVSDAADEAESQLRLAEAVATTMQDNSGDTTLADAVRAIEKSSADRRHDLAQAYVDFGKGRRALQANKPVEAAAAFEAVEKRAGSTSGLLTDYAVYQRGACLFTRNDYAAAGALAERVANSPAHSATRFTFNARINYLRGLVKLQMGDPDGTLVFYRQATKDYEAAGESDSVALMTGRMADALDHVGEVEEAAALRMRALETLDRIGEPARRDPILFDAADVALTRGWYATARLLFTPIAEPAGQQAMWRCAALLGRSSACAAAEDREAAGRDYRSARQACDAVPDADVRERVLASAPILMTESSDSRVEDLTGTIEFLKKTKNSIWLPDMYRRLGRIRSAGGDEKSAEAAFRTGIEVAHQIAGTVKDPLQYESFQHHVDELFSCLVGSLVGRRAYGEALQVTERGRNRSFSDEVVPLAEIGRRLPDDVAVIDLKWTPQVLAGWVITSRGSAWFKNGVDPSFSSAVRRCGGSSACTDDERRRLYDVIVRPWIDDVRPHCRNVVFVVDSDLETLSFASLIDRRTERPLLSDMAVATAPSLDSVLRSGTAYALRAPEPERVALIGPPAHDRLRHPDLVSLEGASDEMGWLHAQYPGADAIAGTEATKRRFLALAEKATVLQFSGHAIGVALPAASSALVLAPEAESPADDLLYVRDLYEARFPRLRLAVLAACSTAGRNGRTKMGNASIARGFLAAGVPVVVGTLWPVEDMVASAFTRAFYRELKKGKSPTRAVHDAQLALIASGNPELSKFSSWAAFITCGAGDVLKGTEHG